MKYAGQNAFDTTGTIHPRYVVIANLPPEDAAGAAHAGRLVYGLGRIGAEVITASEPVYSYARVPLQYRTRRLLARSIAALAEQTGRDTHVIIYASALRSDTIEKPAWYSRLSEKIRRLRLAYAIGKRGRTVTIVLDTAALHRAQIWIAGAAALALAVRRPRGLRLCGVRKSPARLIPAIAHVAQPSTEQAIDAAFALAFSEKRNSGIFRLGPFWLRDAARAARNRETPGDALVRDLDSVFDICKHLNKRGTGGLRPLGLLPAGKAFRNLADQKTAFANGCPPNSNISRFMRHYRINPPNKAAMPPRAARDRAAFARWYLEAAFNRTSTPALPLPKTLVAQACTALADTSAETAANIIDLARRSEELTGLPAAITRYFAAPVGGRAGNLSRMEMICAVHAAMAVRDRALIERPWCAGAVRDWYARVLCRAYPAFRVFSTAAPTQESRPLPVIKIAGAVGGDSGLERNAEMSADIFNRLGLPVSMHSARQSAIGHMRKSAAQSRRLLRPVVLHNINADRIPRQVLDRTLTMGDNPLHIGFLLWEMEKTPPSHALAGQLLDEIWVPSRFVQQAYEAAFGREIHNVGKSIILPDVAPADLSFMGIRPDHRLFMVIFDANSSVERKNPLAAVQAFLTAFPDDPDVRLLVKTTPVGPRHWGDPNRQMAAIRRIAGKDSRVIVEQSHLPFADLLARIRRADCIVSAHRAEGFGYIPAFALYYGRPVITTDYSGTRDFCTQQTAYPVSYRLVAPQKGAFIANVADGVWADVDIDAMAAQMHHIYENPAAAAARAATGQRLLQTRYSPEQQTRRYLHRLRALGVVA